MVLPSQRIQIACRMVGIDYRHFSTVDPVLLIRVAMAIKSKAGLETQCTRCGCNHAVTGVCARSRKYYRDRYEKKKAA
jgi:hypothetical protein